MNMQPSQSQYPSHLQRVIEAFHSPFYLRITARRLEHLASLNLPLAHKKVLEVGAGIGDLSWFYLDRGCQVTAVEVRPENCEAYRYLTTQQPDPCHYQDELKLIQSDIEQIKQRIKQKFEIVHCYGLLYHIENPQQALADLSDLCDDLLLLETCVSFGDDLNAHPILEGNIHPASAFYGVGCRPTRPWLMQELKKHFPYVYMPYTQPAHYQFPLKWDKPPSYDHTMAFYRSIFIASRTPIDNPLLSEELLMEQRIENN